MDELPGLVQLARLPVSDRSALLAGSSVDDPLRAVTELRRQRPDLSPALVSAVVAQRGYQAKALAARALPPDGPWLTTEVGLEQATRPAVAGRRADTLVAAGVRAVVDATAGIGMDSRAFLAAGLEVVAIERDPATFEVCRANLEHAGQIFATKARVVCADSTGSGVIASAMDGLPSPVAVFVDPARRGSHRPVDGSRSRSERDRRLWSPPWSFVEELHDQFAHVAVKAPPGFTPDSWWKAEWIAVGTTVVECALYSPKASTGAVRQSTLLDNGDSWTLTFGVDDQRPPPSGLAGYLAEVHPVARRGGAISRICTDEPALAPVTDSTMWLTADSPVLVNPVLRWFEVLGSGSLDDLAAMCRAMTIEGVALKTAESRKAQHEIRRRLGLADGDEYAVVVIDGLRDCVLVRRMRQT